MARTASAVGRLTFITAIAAISIGAWSFAYEDNTSSAPPIADTLRELLATLVEVWPLAALLLVALVFIAGVNQL